MRVVKFMVIIMSLVMLAGGVVAQDEAEDCDLVGIGADIASMAGELAETDDGLQALLDMDAVIEAARIDCYGMSWSSEVDGQQPVIGPVEIDDGLYRVRVDTEGFYQLTITVLSGDCDGGRGGLMFNESSGTANPAETVLVAENDCEALFTVSNAREEWTLEFEKIR